MAIVVTVQGLVELRSRLLLSERQIEIATQRAVLKTAQAVREAEVEEMKRCFTAPTRFTLNAFKTTFDKARITATVEIKDGYWTRSQNYLKTQSIGGERRRKAFENALQRVGVLPAGWMVVPGEGADLDSYGNISVGQIRQILSWFDAAELVAGSRQNMEQKGRDKRRKGTKTKRGFEYFAALPGYRSGRGSWKNGRTQSLEPGIYRRTWFSFPGVRKQTVSVSAIKPVLIFVKDTNYKPRFMFEQVANQTIDRVLYPELNAAIQKELAKI